MAIYKVFFKHKFNLKKEEVIVGAETVEEAQVRAIDAFFEGKNCKKSDWYIEKHEIRAYRR